MSPARTMRQLIIHIMALLFLMACSEEDQSEQAQVSSQSAAPHVGVITIAQSPLTLTEVLPGRLEATQVAEVRARAAGIVLERTFQEGSLVKAGEVLFKIDPAPMQAALNSAKAALAKAKANLTQARLTVERYAPLVESNTISRQTYDNAAAVQAAAAADVAAAKAALETARLNLDYTTVVAPISGRIGRAFVTVGALVGQGEATHLATVQQLDPIYANLTQSSGDMLRLRRAFASGQLQNTDEGEAKVKLITADNREYPHTGALLFTDMTVDPSTGAVTLRAAFPNPDGFLLPGMYVRAQLEQAIDQSAITIPQQALKRTNQGAIVMVVGDNGKAESRPVAVGRAYENRWVIEDGLEAGDTIIVEGLEKARPGTIVNPVPWRKQASGLTAGKPPSGHTMSKESEKKEATRAI